MAISLESIVRGKQPKPPRIVVYGVDGIGKSTLAADAGNPIFICTEQGVDNIDTNKFPLSASYADVLSQLDLLTTQHHDFDCVVIDSLDWLEPLIWSHLCVEHNKKSIEEFGYGKGYVEAADIWRDFLNRINALNAKGMAVILLAHANIKRFDAPDSDPYDRYEIKLHQRASGLIYEWADAVLFANYQVYTKTKQDGFNEKTRAIGNGERVMYTQERPAFRAKNRYNLPETLPLSWGALVAAINQSFQPKLTEVKHA